MSREEVTILRDVEGIVIPAGNRILVPEGVTVTITQSLGGSFTVIAPHGHLVRISGQDADALGRSPVETETLDSTAPAAGTEPSGIAPRVWEELRMIYDPEIPVNIVDLGLVYGCDLQEEEGGVRVEVRMTMTAPGCGMGDVLKLEAEDRIRLIPGVRSAHVEIVWDPPWDQSKMSEAARLELGFG